MARCMLRGTLMGSTLMLMGGAGARSRSSRLMYTHGTQSLSRTYSPTLTPADGLRSQREVSSNEVVQRNSILCSAVAAQAAACGSLSVSTAGRDAFLPAVCLSWSPRCILKSPVSAVEGVPLSSGKVPGDTTVSPHGLPRETPVPPCAAKGRRQDELLPPRS